MLLRPNRKAATGRRRLLREILRLAWRGLAAGAEVAAAAGNDSAAYFCSAAVTFFAGALVNAVAKLKLAALAIGIHVIGNGRASQANCFQQHGADGSMEIAKLGRLERRRQTHGMDSRSPQTFVRIDVAHPAQDALVEQERFDAGAAPTQIRAEFFFGGFERIEAEFAQRGFMLAILDDSHASEAANVRVAELAAIVEREKNVSVCDYRSLGRTDDELARHSQMNQQGGVAVIGARGLKIEHEKFAVSSHGGDLAAGQGLLHRSRIIDEIRFAQADAEKSSAGQDGSETACDGFYFGEFGHFCDSKLAQCGSRQHFQSKRDPSTACPGASRKTKSARHSAQDDDVEARGGVFSKKACGARLGGCASILVLKIHKTL